MGEGIYRFIQETTVASTQKKLILEYFTRKHQDMTINENFKEFFQYEKNRLYRVHQWRNSSHHLGLEISIRLVRTVINEIKDFFEEPSC